MNGTDYQLIVYVLVVLMFQNKIDIPKQGGVHLDRLNSR